MARNSEIPLRASLLTPFEEQGYGRFTPGSVTKCDFCGGRFAQVSGVCFTYDINAAVGSRVTGAVRQAADGSCTSAVIGLTVASTYTLAINDFMAAGGDGYPDVIGRGTTRNLVDQDLAAYIAANTPITPEIQGRIGCIGLACPTPSP